MSQVKKLSVAKVFGKIDLEELLASPDKRVRVMRCGGRCVGKKEGTSDFGDWTSLVGDFVAWNGETGEESRAPYLFLPDVALTPILIALSQGESVDFLLDLFAVYDKESSVHFVYTWEPVVAHATEDPIKALLAKAKPLMIAGKPVGGSEGMVTPPAAETPSSTLPDASAGAPFDFSTLPKKKGK